MRILLLGEFSNVHNTLAKGLRLLGHEVTVASNGDFWKDYPRDIDLARRPGKLGGLMLMAKVYWQLRKWRDYDVVQLINPIFIELKAERLFPIYRCLKRHNRKIVLCAMGMDYYWVSECVKRMPLRYSDFNIGKRLRTDPPAVKEMNDWLGTAKGDLNIMIAQDCDGIVAGLYEDYICYQPHYEKKTTFIPLPIEMPEKEGQYPHSNGQQKASPTKMRIFIGISKGRSQYKGTDIMLRAAEEVLKKHPDRMELIKVEGVPFEQYNKLMNGSDAILDQLYSYTPSMNPLLAMSKGIVCIGGGEPENYEILGEQQLRPIINVVPTYESVCHELEQLVLHPERLPRLQQESIEYVRKHHDYLKVAREYEAFYQTL